MKLYHTLQAHYPTVLFYGDSAHREIALTFDDGPHPRDTPQVLDVLAKHEVHATFFLVGRYVEQYPQLVRQIHQSGHQLGIHCYRHLPFPLENASSLQGWLNRTRDAVADACSISPDAIRHVRPPYGLFTSKTVSLLAEWGYELIMWSSIPQHWMQPISWSIKQVFNEIDSGGIIVLHDGHGHGRKVAPIVDTIVPKLKAMSYRFIKIEDMKRNCVDE